MLATSFHTYAVETKIFKSNIMEIKKIISKGEILNAEQLAQVTGGAGAKANVNDVDYCRCDGAGDNINRGNACFCQNPPKPANGIKDCNKPIEIPANTLVSSCK